MLALPRRTTRKILGLCSCRKGAAPNVYLMLYPQPLLARQLALNPSALRPMWQALNAIERETLLNSGRVYGGGMHKLEPKELANVPVDELAALVGLPPKNLPRQLELAGAGGHGGAQKRAAKKGRQGPIHC
jgi:hypothetical protein